MTTIHSVIIDNEPNPATLGRRRGQLTDGVDEPGDGLVMGRQLFFQGIELLRKFRVVREHFAQADEGANDLHTSVNRAR